MVIGTAKIKLYAPWVHSLKEKRMTVKSIIDRAKNKFNISIAEVEEMDVHQTIIIGVCCVSNSTSNVNSAINQVVNFIENNTEAVLQDVKIEVL